MSKQNLEKFLKELAQNPALAARYKANPRQVMAEHNVDPAHQDLIMKGDVKAVQDALGGSTAVAVMTIGNFKDQ